MNLKLTNLLMLFEITSCINRNRSYQCSCCPVIPLKEFNVKRFCCVRQSRVQPFKIYVLLLLLFCMLTPVVRHNSVCYHNIHFDAYFVPCYSMLLSSRQGSMVASSPLQKGVNVTACLSFMPALMPLDFTVFEDSDYKTQICFQREIL